MPAENSGSIVVEARSVEALFDDGTEPTYPHTSRLMNPRLALFLEGQARERRRESALEIRVRLNPPSLTPLEEENVSRQIRTYFEEERRLAELELRVNQTEGWGFFRRGLPLILLALLIAGVFYVALPNYASASLGAFVTALVYLLFITIVWVMLWDPIEKLLFDAYLLRARIRALRKLGTASVRFAYGPATPASA